MEGRHREPMELDTQLTPIPGINSSLKGIDFGMHVVAEKEEEGGPSAIVAEGRKSMELDPQLKHMSGKKSSLKDIDIRMNEIGEKEEVVPEVKKDEGGPSSRKGKSVTGRKPKAAKHAAEGGPGAAMSLGAEVHIPPKLKLSPKFQKNVQSITQIVYNKLANPRSKGKRVINLRDILEPSTTFNIRSETRRRDILGTIYANELLFNVATINPDRRLRDYNLSIWFLINSDSIPRPYAIPNTNPKLTSDKIYNSNPTTFITTYNYMKQLIGYLVGELKMKDKTIAKVNRAYYDKLVSDYTNDDTKADFQVYAERAAIKYNRDIPINIKRTDFKTTLEYKEKEAELSHDNKGCPVCFLCGKRLKFKLSDQKTTKDYQFKYVLNLEIEHFIPIVSAYITGVIYCPHNYLPAHGPCNSSKNNTLPEIGKSDVATEIANSIERFELNINIDTVKDKVSSEVVDYLQRRFGQISEDINTKESMEYILKYTLDNIDKFIDKKGKGKRKRQSGGGLSQVELKSHSHVAKDLMKQFGKVHKQDIFVDNRAELNTTIKDLVELMHYFTNIKFINNYEKQIYVDAVKMLVELITFLVQMHDVLVKYHKHAHVGGAGSDECATVHECIKKYLEGFKNEKFTDDPTEYEDIDSRVEMYEARLLFINTYSYMFYNNLKNERGYESYSDFILKRYRKCLEAKIEGDKSIRFDD